ncbi:hypothetical protein [Endozoicomonas euniceicola]|uniref:Uncharacterized protein n=1 Tax=Endozoicomonas euniceicola TaxID=1234143 RepID=A0ABY6GUJ1_9GAMM|nr:hypothetical protein [Endozoicomonas euniceicola]UYM16447.1 hypothetical protein NX720_00490 [Endozoicomonas euniceicola]
MPTKTTSVVNRHEYENGICMVKGAGGVPGKRLSVICWLSRQKTTRIYDETTEACSSYSYNRGFEPGFG